MSLIKFNVISEFKEFLEQDITRTKNQLDTISKEAGEKLRLKEKELENDKEFLSIKEKLEEKTDEKKKKKPKKQNKFQRKMAEMMEQAEQQKKAQQKRKK